jgi:hypothetical protein
MSGGIELELDRILVLRASGGDGVIARTGAAGKHDVPIHSPIRNFRSAHALTP